VGTKPLWRLGLVAVVLALVALAPVATQARVRGSGARSPGGYRLVVGPIAVIEPQRDSHGKRWFTYAVFVRLNRPIPRDGNGSPLGEAPLDGAGGGGGLFLDAYSRPARHCYIQTVENDFAYSRTLKHPHPGAWVTLEVHIQSPANRDQDIALLTRRIRLQRRRADTDGPYYPRRQGCLR